ncbi:MAG: hypothetical protein VR69_00990 [Peptococcaceae bacterium BRH_c4b]|nr:MAG: hypothetical protein VR69_00990 [Peptococcaceae bacterium BRH_c4b]
MNKKHSLKSFVLDIDKIALYDEAVIPAECEDCDEEYKELLLLAQLLAKADYTTKSQGRMENMMAKIISNARKDDQLEDDELDMVAGGVNLNEMSDKKKEKG